jgi:hypothetical protein
MVARIWPAAEKPIFCVAPCTWTFLKSLPVSSFSAPAQGTRGGTLIHSRKPSIIDMITAAGYHPAMAVLCMKARRRDSPHRRWNQPKDNDETMRMILHA